MEMPLIHDRWFKASNFAEVKAEGSIPQPIIADCGICSSPTNLTHAHLITLLPDLMRLLNSATDLTLIERAGGGDLITLTLSAYHWNILSKTLPLAQPKPKKIVRSPSPVTQSS